MTYINVLFYIVLAGIAAGIILGWIRHEAILNERRERLMEIFSFSEIREMELEQRGLVNLHHSSPVFFDLPDTTAAAQGGAQLEVADLPARTRGSAYADVVYEEDRPARESIA